jgi:peptidoglycan/LPS O-acetylase OafA/YrhL
MPSPFNIPDLRRPAAPERVPALDGLRAFAIAAVVAFHAGVLRGGFLGVDLFFVLSGYLIAGILLREHEKRGSVGLGAFWTRRARRLVPAILLLLLAAQLWVRIGASFGDRAVVNGQTAAAVVYASNWFNIVQHVGYWDTGISRSPLNHLWSLAIEEQFYVVFPLLMALLFRRGASHRVILIVLGAITTATLALTPFVFATVGANRAYFGTDTRAGVIGLGAMLAVLLHMRRQRGDGLLNHRLAIGAGAMVAISMILLLWINLTTADTRLYEGGFALHGLASAGLIGALVLAPGAGVSRLFAWPPFVFVGERSYALYLWHWPLLVVLTPAVTGRTGVAHALFVAAAIAATTSISYELVEHPIHYSRVRGARLIASLTVPAIAIATSALAFQPPPPPQFGTNAIVTAGHGGVSLMIVGDSWARNLGMSLAEVDGAHRTTILNMGKGGCGIADAHRERSPEKGDFDTSSDCLTWHATWRAVIDVAHPDAAILMAGNWDQALQDFAGDGVFVGTCTPTFRDRYSRQLDAAIDTLRSGGAMVFVATVQDNDERAGSGPDCMNGLLRDAVTRRATDRVRLLDQYAELCQEHRCPATADGEAVYDESGHLAPHSQQRIARWVLNTVYSALDR